MPANVVALKTQNYNYCSEEDDEVSESDSMPTLAEQFEQIKNCKYIRHSKHYNPERVALEEY